MQPYLVSCTNAPEGDLNVLQSSVVWSPVWFYIRACYFSTIHMICHAHAEKIVESIPWLFPDCPVKHLRYCSHTSRATIKKKKKKKKKKMHENLSPVCSRILQSRRKAIVKRHMQICKSSKSYQKTFFSLALIWSKL